MREVIPRRLPCSAMSVLDVLNLKLTVPRVEARPLEPKSFRDPAVFWSENRPFVVGVEGRRSLGVVLGGGPAGSPTTPSPESIAQIRKTLDDDPPAAHVTSKTVPDGGGYRFLAEIVGGIAPVCHHRRKVPPAPRRTGCQFTRVASPDQ